MPAMNQPDNRDYNEFLGSLTEPEIAPFVEWLGGSDPRWQKNLDAFVNASPHNEAKVYSKLRELYGVQIYPIADRAAFAQLSAADAAKESAAHAKQANALSAESNEIAEEANRIAGEALRKAQQANWLACGSLVAATVSAIAAWLAYAYGK